MNLIDSINDFGSLYLAGDNTAVDMQARWKITLHEAKS